MTVRTLSEAPAPWLGGHGPRAEIVLSSRVRLARNLAGRLFPHRAEARDSSAVLEAVVSAASACSSLPAAHHWDLSDLSSWERQILLERHVASPRLVAGSGPRGVVVSDGDGADLLVNEEDHLRIQTVTSGFQLQTALERAVEVDRALEQSLSYAVSERYGYLTACPTNVGTGLRASVLVHLPGLALSSEIKRVHAAVGEMGMVVRGWFGEGSRVVGDFYQISNQRTLGCSEPEAGEALAVVAERTIELELDARERIVEDAERRRRVEDRVCRSRAILGAARLLTVEQGMACVSDVRLGQWMGFFSDLSGEKLNRFTLFAQPAHLGRGEERVPDPEEAQWLRAGLAREWFGGGSPGPEGAAGP